MRACFFDPDSHEVYLAFAQHWGFTSLPTQPRTPQENGKQERSGGYVKDNVTPYTQVPKSLSIIVVETH